MATIDASIPLQTQPPPPASAFQSLMGFFQVQNQMRQQELGRIQVQQAAQDMQQRNNLMGMIQQHPEWVDSSTGILTPEGSANVIRADPFHGAQLLKDNQEAAKAQAETRSSLATASKVDYEKAAEQHAAVASAFATLRENPSDEAIDRAAASLAGAHVPPELVQGAVAQLKATPDPNIRQQMIDMLSAQNEESRKAVAAHQLQQFQLAHGGMAPEQVQSGRNVAAQQAGETQREREVQGAENTRTAFTQAQENQRQQVSLAPQAKAAQAVPKAADDIINAQQGLATLDSKLADIQQKFEKGEFHTGFLRGVEPSGLSDQLAQFRQETGSVLPDLVSSIRASGATIRLAGPEIQAVSQMGLKDTNSSEANLQIIKTMREQLAAKQAQLNKRLTHYQQGGTDLDFNAGGAAPAGGDLAAAIAAERKRRVAAGQ